MTKSHKMTFAAVAAMAVAMSVAVLVSSLATPVQAKIVEEDTGCETRGGGTPQGQQPTCRGEGLVQETEKRNEGSKDHAPPGLNK